MKVLLVAINAKYIHSNLAVRILSENAGEAAEFLEVAEYTINNQMDAIVRDIYEREPNVLCFSCYIWNIEYVKDIAREISKLMPDVPIWVGGPEVSYEIENIFDENPYIKGIMVGEGEGTLRDLVMSYVKERKLSEVLGIAYRDGEDIVINDNRPFMDMDSLEFLYDDLSKYENKIIYYESSRGCPFNCSYCMSSIEKTVRFRSIPKVLSDLQFFLDSKVAQVKFIDRTYNIRADRTMQMLEYLAEHDNGVTNFHFEMAGDIITDEEIAILNTLRPGYVQIEIGVQSTNEQTIKEIDRKMDLDRVYEVAKRLIEPNNVHIHLDLIAGLPYEDYDTFTKSFDDIYSLHPHELQLGFLKVLKGAKMHFKTEDYGIIYNDKAPYEVLSTKWLSFSDIIHLKEVEEMLEVYYNSGLFPYTMRALEQYFKRPFDIYDGLAKHYKENNLLNISHNRITRYGILKEFIDKVAGDDAKMLTQVLIFDLFLHENLKSRPTFALDANEYKAATSTLHREYAKEYVGINFHIEPFTIDIEKLTSSGELACGETTVLFRYDIKHPVTRKANYLILPRPS